MSKAEFKTVTSRICIDIIENGDLAFGFVSDDPSRTVVIRDDDIAYISVRSHAFQRAVFVPFWPVGGSPTPLMYMALYEIGSTISPRFNKGALSLCRKEKSFISRHVIHDGVSIVPVLPDPSQHQLVVNVTGDNVHFYQEYAYGHPPQNNHPGQWCICQTPPYIIQRNGISKPWERLVKAMQIHHDRSRDPFVSLLTRDPTVDLGKS